MGTRLIRTIVTDTESRAHVIRDFCRSGSLVQLRREHGPLDVNAIGVWLECKRFFGLFRAYRRIGYIGGELLNGLAMAMDKGAIQVKRAYVRSLYAPYDRAQARVSLAIECEGSPGVHKPPAAPRRPVPVRERPAIARPARGHTAPHRDGNVRTMVHTLTADEMDSLKRVVGGLPGTPVPAAHAQRFVILRLAKRTVGGIAITALGRAHLARMARVNERAVGAAH